MLLKSILSCTVTAMLAFAAPAFANDVGQQDQKPTVLVVRVPATVASQDESSIPMATQRSATLLPIRMQVPRDQNGNVQIDRLVMMADQAQQAATPQEITANHLEGDVPQAVQDAFEAADGQQKSLYWRFWRPYGGYPGWGYYGYSSYPYWGLYSSYANYYPYYYLYANNFSYPYNWGYRRYLNNYWYDYYYRF